jgi:hypothetical protein
MTELAFYTQTRQDGGVRTGLELNRTITLLEDFDEGPPASRDDPLGSALIWYVDVRCRGDDLPTEPEAARHWMLAHVYSLREGLLLFADAIAAGADDSIPLSWTQFPSAPAGVQVEAVCSAIRRVSARELGTHIRTVADRLDECLRKLPRPEPMLR